MQYPLYIHRCDGRGYRGRLADFPGAEVVSNSFDGLALEAQRFVQRAYDRSDRILPAPTCDTAALQALDIDDGEGLWRFVDIDLTTIMSQSVRVQLTLNKSLLLDIDREAQERHLSRSAFVSLACAHELEEAADERALPGAGARLAESAG
jgi:hypothetical protein